MKLKWRGVDTYFPHSDLVLRHDEIYEVDLVDQETFTPSIFVGDIYRKYTSWKNLWNEWKRL